MAVANMLAELPTRAFGLTKRAINQSFDNTLEQQLEVEKELQAEAGTTLDFREGVQAFLEKRKPVFVGH
jgi:2-(1,2-epoxy-1,2-dihydrophenyl)acetyl-CoA isomerase